MSNPIPKTFLVSAFLSLCACVSPGEEYNPPPRLQANPEPFSTLLPVTFTATVHARPNYAVIGQPNPSILELRATPADKDGNFLPTGGVVTKADYTAPDASGWSTVTFPPIKAPDTETGGKLAVSVTYKTWSPVVSGYIPVDTTPEGSRTTLFQYSCTSSGDSPAERLRSTVCSYRR